MCLARRVLPVLAGSMALLVLTAHGQGLPNLFPYQPEGWSGPIVVSNTPGTNVDSSSLLPTETLYVDVAVGNGGDADTFLPYTVSLWLDDELVQYWTIDPPHEVWFYYWVEDVTVGPLSPGTYTLALYVDDENNIYESDEGDNVYTKTIVVGSREKPNLKPYAPSGWSSALVISTEQNTSDDASTVTSQDSVFVDWAVANDGSQDVDVTYDVTLLIDGELAGSWTVEPPHEVDYFYSKKDFFVGPLAAGAHEFALVADANGSVAESNETDNRLTRQIQVVEPAAAGQLLLIFPRVQTDSLRGTGLALANPTDRQADVNLLLVDRLGQLRTGAGITNPVALTVPAGAQLSRTIPEFFGADSASASDWVLASSDNLGLVGFFLSYTSDVSGIDGAEAISLLGTSSVAFPEVLCGEGESTEITLIGSGDIDVELRASTGELLSSRVVRLPADVPGSAASTVSQLFGRSVPCNSWVLASGRGTSVYGYEVFGSATSIGGRNGIPARRSALDGTQSLFGAQLADTPAIRTTVTLVNPTDSPARLNLMAYRSGVSDGTAASTRQVTLGPGASLREDARTFLQLPAGDFVGWLRVDADILGVVGDLSFGGPQNEFLSSVQLQHIPVTDVVFSHVADGLGYLTGLTFLNTSRDQAHITLEVFDKTGAATGATQFTLQPLEHRPRLLTELVSGLQPQIGGYIRVNSDVGILTFELFSYVANGRLRSLAAVPPQRGKGLISGRLSPAAVGAALVESLNPDELYPKSRAKGIRLDARQDFVIGEAIVRLEDAALAETIREVLPAGLRPTVVDGRDGHILVRDLLGSGGPVPAGVPGADAQARKLATLDYIELLNGRPGVLYAEPNYIRYPDVEPNDTHYHYQWHYPQIHLPEVWDVTTGSPDVVVAVVDTGARFDHPDLAARLTGGQFDFISDVQNAADGDGIDASAQDPGDDPAGTKSTFHGTHVAGTIGAVTNNNRGVAGINWVSPLMTLRIMGVGGGSDWDIEQAVRYAARLPNSSGQIPSRQANVINMSFGSSTPSQSVHDALMAALAKNVVLVAAAGNANSDEPHYPACYDGVISVGATDLSGGKAPYSNFGPRIDIVAPGGNLEADLNGDSKADGVLSTLWDPVTNQPNYIFYQGTSMATPHVTGVASLMLSVNPALTPAQVRSILQQSAIDLGAAGRDDTFGYGLIDPVAAVRAAAGAGPAEPRLFLSSTSLSFGTVASQLMITVSNGGGGQLTVDAPTVEMDTGQGWLTARLLDSTIIVQVRRDGLSNGVYTGRLNVLSNGGAATVEIRMEVGASPTPQLGTLYVIALDPVNLDSVGGTETTGEAEFRYVLPPMDIGYLLVAAGTDSDGDGYICEEGEYCGLYPVFSDAVNVRVQANETTRNIDFAVSRRVSPNQAGAATWGKRGFAVPAPNLTPFERILPGLRDR